VLVPLVELVFARVTAFALLGLVNTTTKVESRGESGTYLEVIGGLHIANKYGEELKKVKPYLERRTVILES
jgi:metal-dependent hydrolase (beta-lactamase superfamily II)